MARPRGIAQLRYRARVNSAHYKYIAYQGDKTEQLFDMLNDPQEQRNLSGEVAAAGALADHRRMLAEWEAHSNPPRSCPAAG